MTGVDERGEEEARTSRKSQITSKVANRTESKQRAEVPRRLRRPCVTGARPIDFEIEVFSLSADCLLSPRPASEQLSVCLLGCMLRTKTCNFSSLRFHVGDKSTAVGQFRSIDTDQRQCASLVETAQPAVGELFNMEHFQYSNQSDSKVSRYTTAVHTCWSKAAAANKFRFRSLWFIDIRTCAVQIRSVVARAPGPQ